MQIACPWCSYPLVIEEAKIPPHTFRTRCPKCAGGIQLPGTDNPGGAAAKYGPEPPGASPSGNGRAPTATDPPSAPTPAEAPRTTGFTPSSEQSAPAALVALEDAHLASAMTNLLKQQGYAPESLNPWQEKVRLLHQGDYELMVTARSGPVLEEGKTLYKRMDHLSPEARRRTFLILIGEEFQTGDGNQAFVAAADLVVHPSGLSDVGALLARRLEERARVYRAFNDAEARRARERMR